MNELEPRERAAQIPENEFIVDIKETAERNLEALAVPADTKKRSRDILADEPQFSRIYGGRKIRGDDDVLRVPCQKTKNIKEGLEIARRLWDELESHNKRTRRPLTTQEQEELKQGITRRPNRGIGLAAPQIGISKRVCVIACGNYKKALVNPRIVTWSEAKFKSSEGCLSLPGQYETCYRYQVVEVEADNLPEPEIFDISNATLCACVQHEIAHLHGKLIDDFTIPDYPTPDSWDMQWRWGEKPEPKFIEDEPQELLATSSDEVVPCAT